MKPLLRTILEYVGTFVTLFGLAILFMMLMLNWVSGCGDVIHHADGTTHHGQCVSLVELFTDEEPISHDHNH
jgi:hypothetical protein